MKQLKANILIGVTQSKARWRGIPTTSTSTATDTPGIQPTVNDTYNSRNKIVSSVLELLASLKHLMYCMK